MTEMTKLKLKGLKGQKLKFRESVLDFSLLKIITPTKE